MNSKRCRLVEIFVTVAVQVAKMRAISSHKTLGLQYHVSVHSRKSKNEHHTKYVNICGKSPLLWGHTCIAVSHMSSSFCFGCVKCGCKFVSFAVILPGSPTTPWASPKRLNTKPSRNLSRIHTVKNNCKNTTEIGDVLLFHWYTPHMNGLCQLTASKTIVIDWNTRKWLGL